MRFLHERPISLKVGFHVRREDYQLLSRFVSAMHMSMRTFFTTKKQGGPVDSAAAAPDGEGTECGGEVDRELSGGAESVFLSHWGVELECLFPLAK